MERNVSAEGEILRGQRKSTLFGHGYEQEQQAYDIADDGGESGAAAAPVKDRDEEGVQGDIQQGAGKGGQHGIFDISVGADRVAQSAAHDHERRAEGQDPEVFRSVGGSGLIGSEKASYNASAQAARSSSMPYLPCFDRKHRSMAL